MNKITPQQAFEAAKTLWPNAQSVRNDLDRISVYNGKTWHQCGDAKVEWPKGVDRWPPLPEPKWRDARMPEDYGKEARFRDGTEDWVEGRLCGQCDGDFRWVKHSGTGWKQCQVRDEAPATFRGVLLEVKADPSLKPGQMAIKPTISCGGQTFEVNTIEITTRSMLEEALLKGGPVQCGIDWAEPRSDWTATKQQTIPFVGGPKDGLFYAFGGMVMVVEVPIRRTGIGWQADGTNSNESFETVIYTLRTIAGISLYAPEGMTDRDALIRLLENYHPPKAKA